MSGDASNNRHQRVNVTIKVSLKYPDRETFVERFSQNLSRSGIFIRAKDPVPVGSRIRFDYHLVDKTRILRGVGLVRWVRTNEEANEPAQPPGMGIEFVDLDPQSEELINEVVNRHGEGVLAPKRQRPKTTTIAAAPPPAKPKRPVSAKADVKLDDEEEGALDALLGAVPSALDPNQEKLRPAPLVPEAPSPGAKPASTSPESELRVASASANPSPQDEATSHVLFVDLCGSCLTAALRSAHGDMEGAKRFMIEPCLMSSQGAVSVDPRGMVLPEVASWLFCRWPSAAAAGAARRLGTRVQKSDQGSADLLLGDECFSAEAVLHALIDGAAASFRALLSAGGQTMVVLPSTSAMRIGRQVQQHLRNAGASRVGLMSDASAMLAAADVILPPDEHAVALYVGRLESRITLIRGPQVVVAALGAPDAGLWEADRRAAERAAKALLSEHEIDVDDDPSLQAAVAEQIEARRRADDSSNLALNIAGGIVDVSHESLCEWLEPLSERLLLLLENALRAHDIEPESLRAFIVAADEALWPGCSEALTGFLDVAPRFLTDGPWCRIVGAMQQWIE